MLIRNSASVSRGHRCDNRHSLHCLEATMAFHVRRIDYFSATVRDDPGEAYKLLATLANLGVNLLAFTAGTVQFGSRRSWLIVHDPRAGSWRLGARPVRGSGSMNA